MKKRQNSFGIKAMKSFFFFVGGIIFYLFFLPPLFSIAGAFIEALPFEVPHNFIVADYIGMLALFGFFVLLVWLTKKWAWR